MENDITVILHSLHPFHLSGGMVLCIHIL